jgi:hypothetical protein
VDDPLGAGVFAPEGGPCGIGAHEVRLALSRVESVSVFAVAVPFDTTATMLTVSPDLTAAIPVSPPFTEVPESTV